MATRPQAAIATAGAYRERRFMVIAPPFLRSTAQFECLDADWRRFVGIFRHANCGMGAEPLIWHDGC